MTLPHCTPYDLTSITSNAEVHCYDTVEWIANLHFTEMNIHRPNLDDPQALDYVPLDMEAWAKGHVKLWERPDEVCRTLMTLHLSQNYSLAQAVRLFNAAAACADVLDVYVPAEFRSSDVQLQIDPMFHLAVDVDIVGDIAAGGIGDVAAPCAYQVWKRGHKPHRNADQLRSYPDFVFCDRAEADLAIGRNGGITSPAACNDDKDIFVQAKGVSVGALRTIFDCMDDCFLRHEKQAKLISKRYIANAYVDHYLRTKGAFFIAQ
mgnify:CR=1 FL=1